ncbi:MAG: hypothetical protein RSD90_07705, partial [Anaerovoracaceae bacterium]
MPRRRILWVFGRKSCAKAEPRFATTEFSGAKAVPTSCVGKSWQWPCPKVTDCKAYAIWGFCLPISGN